MDWHLYNDSSPSSFFSPKLETTLLSQFGRGVGGEGDILGINKSAFLRQFLAKRIPVRAGLAAGRSIGCADSGKTCPAKRALKYQQLNFCDGDADRHATP
jgi:hypothetical protein